MEPLVLTAEQIKSLAEFAKQEGQPRYTITEATIPAFEVEDGSVVPEYTGLIAWRSAARRVGITAGIH